MDREEQQKVGTSLAKAKQPKRIGCFICKIKCPSYMVTDRIWKAVWPTYKQDKKSHPGIYLELCFACLRERLFRPLTIDDFTDSPINDGVRVGFELGIDYVMQKKRRKHLKEATERLMDRLDLADMLGE